MSIELPLYRQEKDNTCSLACLRMVLAAFGTRVTEDVIEAKVKLEERGTPIEQLERLALDFNLVAEIQDTTVEELRQILAEGKLPIVYIDRAVFDLTPDQRKHHSLRHAKIHNVIPTQITAKSVTFHDPLRPRPIRRTIRLFRQAYNALGGRCIVCAKPDPEQIARED